jgi:hypothetical protein
MWQRIQTLYLLISAGLLAGMCFSNAYSFSTPEGLQSLTWWQVQKPYFGILLGILTFLVVLALAVYKVRILQMRLAVLSAVIALGMQIWIGVMVYLSLEGTVYSWTAIFPLVVCISNFLAARGCFQDQLMVESAYRVREMRRRNKK